jgi:hypothetical protein
MMNKMWIVAALATMVAGGSAAVQARSTPSYGGSAALDSESGCFTNGLGQGSGRVQQTCTGTRRFCVALPVASSGGKSVKVFGFAPSVTANVTCRAEATNSNGVVVSSSPVVAFDNFGTFDQMTLNGASVPSFGGLFVCCNMAQSTQLGVIDYNE